MKIIHKDLKKGIVRIQVENSEDLWYLSWIIEAGDTISGRTERKIRIGDKEERASKNIKKSFFCVIEAESVDFQTHGATLRVSGKITGGDDALARGDYHTFSVEQGSALTIEKRAWLKYQVDKLKEASELKGPVILMMILDREDARFALLRRSGYEIISALSGDVQKKDVEQRTGDFYGQLTRILQDYCARYAPDRIIVASPAFWKDEFLKQLRDASLRKRVITATCSSVNDNAISELMKRDELKEALRQDRLARETSAVERLFVEISKSGLYAYGFAEVERAVNSGAVGLLMVSDGQIRKSRSTGDYEMLEALMKAADKQKAEVIILSSDYDPGKRLDGLGGIGAVLRFRMLH